MIGRRRLRKNLAGAELELTAFINPMVVLVTFLLINVVFTHTSVLDLKLPGPAAPDSSAPTPPVKPLLLEVIVRANQVDLADRNGGPLASVPNIATGSGPGSAAGSATGPDLASLSAQLRALKDQHPDQKDATVLVEADISYDRIVQVMDAVRSSQRELEGHRIVTELFPQVALGDAPDDGSASRARPPTNLK